MVFVVLLYDNTLILFALVTRLVSLESCSLILFLCIFTIQQQCDVRTCLFCAPLKFLDAIYQFA